MIVHCPVCGTGVTVVKVGNKVNSSFGIEASRDCGLAQQSQGTTWATGPDCPHINQAINQAAFRGHRR